jgi:hypothetical protein
MTAVAIKKEETLISKGLLFYSPLKHLFKPGQPYIIITLSYR